ncbi:antitoxin [Longimicrobium sp.]|jgi:antitoxin VapB|uniref:antitoxin n=1 Tax=Longimicrobium sp. TaxID=2029185 RepID=UPI002EDB29D2
MKKEFIATLFMNGGSQAVRLPKECRFEGTAVRVRKEGAAVILEPVEKRAWPVGFWEDFWKDGPAGDDLVVPEPLPDAPHRDAILDDYSRKGS